MKLAAIKELMNTPQERHAFVIGFCEVLCPLPPRFVPSPLTGEGDNPREAVSRECHYYSAGRALALLAWLGIVKLVLMVF